MPCIVGARRGARWWTRTSTSHASATAWIAVSIARSPASASALPRAAPRRRRRRRRASAAASCRTGRCPMAAPSAAAPPRLRRTRRKPRRAASPPAVTPTSPVCEVAPRIRRAPCSTAWAPVPRTRRPASRTASKDASGAFGLSPLWSESPRPTVTLRNCLPTGRLGRDCIFPRVVGSCEHTSVAQGAGASGVGYASLRNTLAVKFDTWHNAESADPWTNHVAVGQFPTARHLTRP